jgi:hypothetical protein
LEDGRTKSGSVHVIAPTSIRSWNRHRNPL